MKGYLADTCILFWLTQSPEKLSSNARQILEDETQDVYFSTASLWEVAIKVSLKKLEANRSITEWVQTLLQNGLKLLPILPKHLERIVDLPMHHRDPFDRLLIAQAIKEDLQIITADKSFAEYPVGVLW